MTTTTPLFDDAEVVRRILDHIDHETTDLAQGTWREPVENYRSETRFRDELALMRSLPAAFCPSAALPTAGSFVAREAAGTPILAVRGHDGRVRAFRNACRHRGAELARGSGCQLAFTCRYHGWTYALDGRLRHVPHERGFPGLDKDARGLVEVHASETQGLVFVTQRPSRDAGLDALPSLIGPEFRLVGSGESELQVNWKIFVEGFLEGYHIRSTHPKTFYPIQYDNVNVVERFGDHNRIAFPYQAIERQRGLAPEQRSADGKLTYVYHLFPNAMVATFPGRIVLAIPDPIAVDRTRLVNYLLTNRDTSEGDAQAALEKGRDLVNAGANEDQEVACAIQRSLASDANEFFEFGLFEGAIGHFHRTLHTRLAALAARKGSGS